MENRVNSEQEIDLIKLLKDLWERKITIFKWCGVGVFFALIVAFSIPRGYESQVKLIPELSSPNSSLGNLGSLASMVGVNVNSSMNIDAISAMIYPDVVSSLPFVTSLFSMEVSTIDGGLSTDLYTYMFQYQKKSWWMYIIEFPKAWISRFIRFVSGEKIFGNTAEEVVNLEYLTKQERRVIGELNKSISVGINTSNDIVTVSVEMQDPRVAQQVAKVVTDKLQNYITDYRTQKSKDDMECTYQLYLDSRTEYYRLQNEYAAFIDKNRNITSSVFAVEQERMQNEMSLAYSVYSNFAVNYETSKLKVQERTPVYTIINPSTTALKASSPNKMFILLVFVFLSVCASSVYLIIKDKLLDYLFSGQDNTETNGD